MVRDPTRRAAPAWAMALLLAAAIATALLLAGCGGGDEVVSLRTSVANATSAVPANRAASAPPASVQLSGCVVDDYFQPRADTPVRAIAADGRLVGNAQSDARGAFRLPVPAGQDVSLAVDRPDGDFIKVASGLRSRALATCLVDPSA